jgi:hypothetical protein
MRYAGGLPRANGIPPHWTTAFWGLTRRVAVFARRDPARNPQVFAYQSYIFSRRFAAGVVVKLIREWRNYNS